MRLKWTGIGAALILLTFMLIHGTVESASLQIGLSWTFSKLAPYLLQFVVVVLLSSILAQLFGLNFAKKKLIMLSSIVVFSGIAFAVNPIYEGDFDNSFDEVIIKNNGNDFEVGLTMVALPGCRYCYDRIETLNSLKKYQQNIPITVVMISGDSIAMADYSEKLSSEINVIPATNEKQLSQIVRGSFPAFIYKKEDVPFLYHWNQIGFGSGALDWITEDN